MGKYTSTATIRPNSPSNHHNANPCQTISEPTPGLPRIKSHSAETFPIIQVFYSSKRGTLFIRIFNFLILLFSATMVLFMLYLCFLSTPKDSQNESAHGLKIIGNKGPAARLSCHSSFDAIKFKISQHDEARCLDGKRP